MKQILTAMNNPQLNELLKKENKFKIVTKDISYKEGILEILEENKNIDYIFISENIEGEIDLINLLKKIKKINSKIEINLFLNKKNNILEKKLKKIKINKVFYKNELKNNNLIKIIENTLEKNNKKIMKKENINCIKNLKIKKDNNKIILITGGEKVGKTTITLILSYYLSKNNNKIALILYNLKKYEIIKFLKIKKYENRKITKYKINRNLNIFYNIDQKNINFIIDKLKNKFDYIIIESNIKNNSIIKKVDLIFFIIKPELKNIKEIYFKYINEFYFEKEKLFIIINKVIKKNISIKIISKIFNIKNKKFILKNNFKYKKIKNNFIKNKKILNNKKTKKQFNKIILKIKNKSN